MFKFPRTYVRAQEADLEEYIQQTYPNARGILLGQPSNTDPFTVQDMVNLGKAAKLNDATMATIFSFAGGDGAITKTEVLDAVISRWRAARAPSKNPQEFVRGYNQLVTLFGAAAKAAIFKYTDPQQAIMVLQQAQNVRGPDKTWDTGGLTQQQLFERLTQTMGTDINPNETIVQGWRVMNLYQIALNRGNCLVFGKLSKSGKASYAQFEFDETETQAPTPPQPPTQPQAQPQTTPEAPQDPNQGTGPAQFSGGAYTFQELDQPVLRVLTFKGIGRGYGPGKDWVTLRDSQLSPELQRDIEQVAKRYERQIVDERIDVSQKGLKIPEVFK